MKKKQQRWFHCAADSFHFVSNLVESFYLSFFVVATRIYVTHLLHIINKNIHKHKYTHTHTHTRQHWWLHFNGVAATLRKHRTHNKKRFIFFTFLIASLCVVRIHNSFFLSLYFPHLFFICVTSFVLSLYTVYCAPRCVQKWVGVRIVRAG